MNLYSAFMKLSKNTADAAFNDAADPTKPLDFSNVIEYAKSATGFSMSWLSIAVVIVIAIAVVGMFTLGIRQQRDILGKASPIYVGSSFAIAGLIVLLLITQAFHINGNKRELEYEVTKAWIDGRYDLQFTNKQIADLNPQKSHSKYNIKSSMNTGGVKYMFRKALGGFELTMEPEITVTDVPLAKGIPERRTAPSEEGTPEEQTETPETPENAADSATGAEETPSDVADAGGTDNT